MKTVLIGHAPSALHMALAALRAGGRRTGSVPALPAVTYVREQVTLERAHVERYAQVCGFGAVHGVPLSYPQLLTFPLVMAFLSSDDCPWPAMGTVHLANRIVQHQALSMGDALRVELTTGELLAHDRGQVFTLDLRVLRDQKLVWEGTQTLLRLGVKDAVGPAYASRLDADIPLSRQADWWAPTDIGRRYGRVSGDINPIHLSMLSARLFGFRRAIAHGLWTQARALAALMPGAPLEQAELDAEFKTPLFLPARASLWTRHSSDSKGHKVSFEVRNERGDKPHLRGRIAHASITGTRP
jgi:acyl dehydratase